MNISTMLSEHLLFFRVPYALKERAREYYRMYWNVDLKCWCMRVSYRIDFDNNRARVIINAERTRGRIEKACKIFDMVMPTDSGLRVLVKAGSYDKVDRVLTSAYFNLT